MKEGVKKYFRSILFALRKGMLREAMCFYVASNSLLLRGEISNHILKRLEPYPSMYDTWVVMSYYLQNCPGGFLVSNVLYVDHQTKKVIDSLIADFGLESKEEQERMQIATYVTQYSEFLH